MLRLLASRPLSSVCRRMYSVTANMDRELRNPVLYPSLSSTATGGITTPICFSPDYQVVSSRLGKIIRSENYNKECVELKNKIDKHLENEIEISKEIINLQKRKLFIVSEKDRQDDLSTYETIDALVFIKRMLDEK